MTALSVNLNKFALLRNSRDKNSPNIISLARRCIKAGANGITVHPRPDQRHTIYRDVYDLASLIKKFPTIEFNVEGNPIYSFLELVKQVKPNQCTLVPDSPNQLTSDHGWDLRHNTERLKPIVNDLQKLGIRVSIFLDPDSNQISLAKMLGTDRIELYTETFANSFGKESQEDVLEQYRKISMEAQELGLGVNAGHDLNLHNLGLFLTIPKILEVSIGHAIAVDSIDYGLEVTLNKYLETIQIAHLKTQ